LGVKGKPDPLKDRYIKAFGFPKVLYCVMGVLYANKIRLNDIEAVRRLLGRVINELLDEGIQEIDIKRYRTIVYTAATLIQALEKSDIEKRICKLEDLIKKLDNDMGAS
jgi:hypothetical protein